MSSPVAHRLLDGRVWRWTAMVLAGCLIVVVVLGVLVAHQSRVDHLDQAIDWRVIRALGNHERLMQWLAAAATAIPAGGTSLVVAVACLVTGRLKGAILAVLAVPVASALCDSLVKPVVRRGALAYPSGHVTSILALTAMLTLLLAAPPRPLIRGRARLLIPAVVGLIACGVAIAVVGLQWHYFTDTIGGAALGIGTVCALALLLDLPAVSRWLQNPTDWLLSRTPAYQMRTRLAGSSHSSSSGPTSNAA